MVFIPSFWGFGCGNTPGARLLKKSLRFSTGEKRSFSIPPCSVEDNCNIRRMSTRKRAASQAAASKPKRYRRTPRMAMVARRPRIGELKGMDTVLTVAGPVIATTNTNADAFTLNLIQAGTGSWNRVGKKAYMQSVRLVGNAQYNIAPAASTLNTVNAVLRMVVVWDKQPSGTLPTFATIFGYTSQDGTEASNVLAPLRYDNIDRFQVLKDERVSSNSGAVVTGGTGNIYAQYFPFDCFIPLGNRETVFSGQSSPMTIADVSSGALYVFFRSTAATDDAADWSITSDSIARLRYTD